MASGKTTLARALAAGGTLDFVDLDDAVEGRAGCSVAEIFATDGEQAFRSLESSMLRELAAPGVVMACGGGTPCFGDNLDFMLGAGTVVCLEASPDTIVRRLLEAPEGKRPLVDSYRSDPAALRTHVERMIAARKQFYGRAHAVFDADRLDTADQIEESVSRFKSLFNI